MSVLRAFASMLPHDLESLHFFEARMKLSKFRQHQFKIPYNRKACPLQFGSDYGFFMIKFIKFLMTKGLDIKKCVQEKMDIMQFNKCVQLYYHGLQKRLEMYDVGDDFYN